MVGRYEAAVARWRATHAAQIQADFEAAVMRHYRQAVLDNVPTESRAMVDYAFDLASSELREAK